MSNSFIPIDEIMTPTDKKLRYAKVRDTKSPTRGTEHSAGIDVFVPNDLTIEQLHKHEINTCVQASNVNTGSFRIPSHGSILIPSGVHFDIPDGFALIAHNKSGIATKKHLDIGACVVDADYQGEVHISLTNTSKFPVEISTGDKIVQFLLIPVCHRAVEEIQSLDELYPTLSERGDGAFGSTGTS